MTQITDTAARMAPGRARARHDQLYMPCDPRVGFSEGWNSCKTSDLEVTRTITVELLHSGLSHTHTLALFKFH